MRILRWFQMSLVLAAVLIPSAACETPTSLFTLQRLRVVNIGTVSINDLVIRFPGSTVTFGTIPPGTTTAFKQVPGGVYGYGAFDFVADSVLIRQPVIDWVGEQPMEGEAFSYSLELITAQSGRPAIRVATVARDQ